MKKVLLGILFALLIIIVIVLITLFIVFLIGSYKTEYETDEYEIS